MEATSNVTVESREFNKTKNEQIWTKEGNTNNPFTLESSRYSKFLTATNDDIFNITIEGNYEQSDSV